MNYRTAIINLQVAENIPYEYENRPLSTKMVAKLAILQTSYKNIENELNDFMQGVLAKMKKEGFDEWSMRIARMENIDAKSEAVRKWKEDSAKNKEQNTPCPNAPTVDELAEANEIRLTKKDYDSELSALSDSYDKAYEEKLNEPVNSMPGAMSDDLFESIIDMIGVGGKIKFKGNNGEFEIPKSSFIKMIAGSLLNPAKDGCKE